MNNNIVQILKKYIKLNRKVINEESITLEQLEQIYYSNQDLAIKNARIAAIRKLKNSITNAFYCAGFDDENRNDFENKRMTSLLRENFKHIFNNNEVRLGIFSRDEIDEIIVPAVYNCLEKDDVYNLSKSRPQYLERYIKFIPIDELKDTYEVVMPTSSYEFEVYNDSIPVKLTEKKFIEALIALRNHQRHFSFNKKQIQAKDYNVLGFDYFSNLDNCKSEVWTFISYFQKLKLSAFVQQNYVTENLDKDINKDLLSSYCEKMKEMSSYLYNYTGLRNFFYKTKDDNNYYNKFLYNQLKMKSNFKDFVDFRQNYLTILNKLGLLNFDNNIDYLSDFFELRDQSKDIIPYNYENISYELKLYEILNGFEPKKNDVETCLEVLKDEAASEFSKTKIRAIKKALKDFFEFESDFISSSIDKAKVLKDFLSQHSKTYKSIIGKIDLTLEKYKAFQQNNKNEFFNNINSDIPFELNGQEMTLFELLDLKYVQQNKVLNEFLARKSPEAYLKACGFELSKDKFNLEETKINILFNEIMLMQDRISDSFNRKIYSEFKTYEDYKKCKIACLKNEEVNNSNFEHLKQVKLNAEDFVKFVYRYFNLAEDDVNEIFKKVCDERMNFELGEISIKPLLLKANKYLYECLKKEDYKPDETLNAFILGLTLCFGNELSDDISRGDRSKREYLKADKLNEAVNLMPQDIFIKRTKDFEQDNVVVSRPQHILNLDANTFLFDFSQSLSHYGMNIYVDKEGNTYIRTKVNDKYASNYLGQKVINTTIYKPSGLGKMFENLYKSLVNDVFQPKKEVENIIAANKKNITPEL